MPFARYSLAFAGALLMVASPAIAQEGPLDTRDHRAIDLPFLRINLRGDVLAEGDQSLGFGLTSANDLREIQGVKGLLYEDYEVERFVAQYRRGFKNGLDLTVELPIVDRGGGILDPLIEFWHQHVLGINVPLRTDTPYGQCRIDLPNGQTFGSAFGVGDVSAQLTKALGPKAQFSLALKLPTGDPNSMIGSGAADVGFALQDRFHIARRLDLYAEGAEVFQGKATVLANSRTWAYQDNLSLVYHATPKDDWILQWNSEESAIVTAAPQSDETQRVLTFGYRRKWRTRSLEMFFSEDGDWLNYRVPELDNVGPDFTVGIRLVSKF
jgi:hypothetical protein